MSDYKPPLLMPMNIADILDASVRLYRSNFGPFMAIIAIVYVPMALFQVLLAFAMGRTMETMAGSSNMPSTESFVAMGGAYAGLLLVNVLAVPLAQGALSVAVSRRYLGYPATVADAYGTIGARWGALIAAVLLVGLAAGAGTLLCLVPGIYLGIMWMFITPIIAIEGLSVMEALRRSWDLVTGEWWRCFSTYLLLSLLVVLVSGAVSWPVSGLAAALMAEKHMALAQALSTGISTAVSIVVQPVLIIGLVLLYYDMRVRKEGFDLYVLAQAMNVPAEQVPTYETYVKTPEVTRHGAPGAPSGVSPELVEYARQAKAAAMAYDEAYRELLAGGWDATLLDRDLPLAWTEGEPPAPPVAPPPVALPPVVFPAVEPSPQPPPDQAPAPPPATSPGVDPFSPDAPTSNHTSEQP